jgi:hypothetical protein
MACHGDDEGRELSPAQSDHQFALAHGRAGRICSGQEDDWIDTPLDVDDSDRRR